MIRVLTFSLLLLGLVQGLFRQIHSSRRTCVVSYLSSSGTVDLPVRIGHGFDIHRLVEGNKLVVGGVYIPYKTGADAHSDGDAMYHR